MSSTEFLGWLSSSPGVLSTLALLAIVLYKTLAHNDTGHLDRSTLLALAGQPWPEKFRAVLATCENSLLNYYRFSGSALALRKSVGLATGYVHVLLLASYWRGGPSTFAGLPLFPEEPGLVRATISATLVAILLATVTISTTRTRVEGWAQRYAEMRLLDAMKLAAVSGITVAAATWTTWAVVRNEQIDSITTLTVACGLTVLLPLAAAVGVRIGGGRFIAVAMIPTAMLGIPLITQAPGTAWAAFNVALAGFASGLVLGRGPGSNSTPSLLLVPLAAVLPLLVVSVTPALAVSDSVLRAMLVSTFLLLVLPLLNGIFVWISLRSSRHFMRQAVANTSTWRLLLDIVLALCLGVLLCAGLLLALASAVASFDLFPELVELNWSSLAQAARTDPWGQGLSVTLMLLLTLIPILVQVTAVSLASGLQLLPRRRLVRYLNRIDSRFENKRPGRIELALLTGAIIFSLALLVAPLLGTVALVSEALLSPLAGWLYLASQRAASPYWLVAGAILLGRQRRQMQALERRGEHPPGSAAA